MGAWLLFAALQLQPRPQPPDVVSPTPRFAVGGDFGGAVAYAGEGGGPLLGAGLRATIPLWKRDSLNLRVMHVIPQLAGGMYELRWQRAVNRPGPFKPDYAGVGAVGFYWMETGRYGRVKPRLGGVIRPLVLSLTAGWNLNAGRRMTTPVELSVFGHPYGAVAASLTIGATWSPRGTSSER